MSNSTQYIGSQGVWQQWYEVSTGLHARQMAVSPVPSTEILGYVKIDQTTPGASNAVVVQSTGGINLRMGTLGEPVIAIDGVGSLIDGETNGITLLDKSGNSRRVTVGAFSHLYNEASWDRTRGNSAVTVLASTTRTANTNSADQVNYNARAHILHIAYDTSTGASLTPTLQVKDSLSGLYNTVWTAAATVVSTSTSATLYSYLIDPSASTASTGFRETARVRMGRTWRLAVTHSSSGATLYSASVDNLV